jgi:hypothetical protein
MLKKLFGKKIDKPENKDAEKSSMEDHLMKVIAEKKKEDPLIGLKIGSKELNQRLIAALKDEKGVHVQTLLTILGSLAGFSCQMAIREELVDTGKRREEEVFVIVEGADGNTYYFGDFLNKPLAEDQYSIWSLTAGIAQHLGATNLPNLKDIFSHVSSTVGGDAFGIPQVAENHKAGDLPINYVKTMWKKVTPIVNKYCDRPLERPILYGFAVQEIIQMSKDVIAPEMAVKIVMESAVPMSKIDPKLITT